MHSYNEICKQKKLNALDEKQFNRQFNKLKTKDFGEIVINAFESRKSWFRFKENMIRGYVRMLAENNGVILDFERNFTAGEPTVRHSGIKNTTYRPLTIVEERYYRLEKKEISKKKNEDN